jgi:dethiobiotin synthetase
MGFQGIFVTGTDTGVGKTWIVVRMVQRLRAQGTRVGAYKPVCSGASRSNENEPVWDDVEALSSALDHQFPRTRICPQCFASHLAPPVAANAEGREVDRDLLRSGAYWWRDQVDLLIVEGVGGLFSPISDRETVADLAADLGFPLLVVAADRLGMINQTLLTLESARTRGLQVAGVILNHPSPVSDDPSTQTNAAWLARFSDVPILGAVEHEDTGLLRPDAGSDRMDWLAVAANAAVPPVPR